MSKRVTVIMVVLVTLVVFLPIPESRILQPNLSQYIGQWYYTSFYNTHTAEQAPINKIILSEDSEGLVQVDFFGPNLMHSGRRRRTKG